MRFVCLGFKKLSWVEREKREKGERERVSYMSVCLGSRLYRGCLWAWGSVLSAALPLLFVPVVAPNGSPLAAILHRWLCGVFVSSPYLVAGRARSSSHLSSAVLSHPFVTNNYSTGTH